MIRDAEYWRWNSVKHWLVGSVRNWPLFSFHRDVAAGWRQGIWAGGTERVV